MRLALAVLASAMLLAGQPRVLNPAGAAKPVGPYSPALEVRDYVYVSGQGVRDGAGAMPSGIEAQTRQCLANVRASLEAAGLEFRHVAASQLYLLDLANLPVVERLWAEAFGSVTPPRITLGVTRMPTDTTVEITVVARRNPSDRVYLNAIYGETRKEVNRKLTTTLKTAALTSKQVAAATWYTIGAPEQGVVNVAALPANARWAVSAIASKRPGTATVFCDVVASKPGGSVEAQTVEAFGLLKSCLGKNGATLADLVATNVYLDDITNFSKMNGAYAAMFTGLFPTRTTVQPVAPQASGGTAVRLSGIAEKR